MTKRDDATDNLLLRVAEKIDVVIDGGPEENYW
jgi:hypothetical protein